MNKKIEVNEETFIILVGDIREIKAVIKGDEYHPNGMVHQMKENTKNIEKLKRRQTGFFAMIGGAWTVFTLSFAYLISKN